MIRTLTKLGSDLALVIDEAMLDAIGAGPDTPFETIVSDGSLILTPVNDEDPKLNGAIAAIHGRFGGAMRRLSE